MLVSAPVVSPGLAREVDQITLVLEENGPLDRNELARRVGARFWGPGRFAAALREALLTGRAQRVDRRRFAARRREEPARS
jgi:endo-1,4-beta-D-glucanase Y